MQKTVIGGVSALYLIWHAPQAFKSFWSRSVRLLFVISVLETLAVVLFLVSLVYEHPYESTDQGAGIGMLAPDMRDLGSPRR